MSINEILNSALNLPIDQRVELSNIINDSLNPIDKDIEQNWIEEAQNRLKLLDDGKMNTISTEKFFGED